MDGVPPWKYYHCCFPAQPDIVRAYVSIKELCEAGFKEGEDFVLLNHVPKPWKSISSWVILRYSSPGYYSNADAKATTDFAREMMRKNPALTAIAFSVSEMNGYPWKIRSQMRIIRRILLTG